MVIGFWKRLLADFLDSLILAVFGILLCIPFSHYFFNMETSGMWVGLVVSFLYTGLLQSSLGEGQSFAKKYLGIQVLSMDGEYLSLPKSFFRYTVIAFIAYAGAFQAIFNLVIPNPQVVTIVVSVLFLLALFGCIFLVPFHPLKRGLHDLIAGSIVVKKGTYSKELVKMDQAMVQKEKWAFAFCGVCCLAVVAGGFFMFATLSKSMGVTYSEITKTQSDIAQKIGNPNIQVNLNSSTFNGQSSTNLQVS